MTETKIKADVVYCKYCEAGMSVPVREVPDDPMCKSCDRVRNPQHTEREIHEIIEEAGVETGNRVRYDGDEWTVKSSAWGFTVHLTRVPKKPTQEIPGEATEIIREHGVDVRKLTTVDE